MTKSGRKSSTKKESASNKLVCCYDCKLAYLMRSQPCNPIVAECTQTKERNVASTQFKCEFYNKRIQEAVINPMIFLNINE